MILRWKLIGFQLNPCKVLHSFRELHNIIFVSIICSLMKDLRDLEAEDYALHFFSEMILLIKVQLIIIDLVEANNGELEQGYEVLDYLCHPLELLLLLIILILGITFSVRELDLASCVASIAHHHRACEILCRGTRRTHF